MTIELTNYETGRLDELESIVKDGMGVFAKVGKALAEIRAAKLYRNTHGTFEAYCKDKWGMTKSYANNLISSEAVVRNLNDNNCCQIPKTESQARPLSKLEPEQQPIAWQNANDRAESENRNVTAKDVEIEVKAITEVIDVEDEQPKAAPTVDYERGSMAMHYAKTAILQLERIGSKDPKRQEAYDHVRAWMASN